MQAQNNLSPKARIAKRNAKHSSQATLAERIRIKMQYLNELENPLEYAEMEAQLRVWLKEFEVEEWADKTVLHWRESNGVRVVLRAHTKGEAILRVYKDEAAKRIAAMARRARTDARGQGG